METNPEIKSADKKKSGIGSVSVVVVSYRRKTNLERILRGWLGQTPDVWLCDCGVNLKTKLPIKIVKFDPDPGNKARHAVSLLTNGDFVIKADDDLLPKSGLIEDFLHSHKLRPGGIFGIHGRTFRNKKYYGGTSGREGRGARKLIRVDFVGVCTFTSRDNLPFDLKGCESPFEDLFWQMKVFPSVKKWVIPTKNYEKLPESSDKKSLCCDPQTRKIREAFYKKYYLRNYR